ncbi:MAG: hypothetical protein A2070_07365 [Bdellovibrionales bacterium GWC1_52_8]|nr:MAG: hypothetical protein A2Z97_00165 [Bdellovibrionales bacterium GWB1_52_6]OFZ04096.1 MAG: hypothetical protein A2X97_14950 [Bdellovibrionales bacterium GWA1_52_35]OFZ36623.1 MAG: hypothetical protein A2070_07365 [Bdellovibrionales bacterium GWC1_52_8]
MSRPSNLSRSNQIIVRRIGLKIHKYLFENDKPIEWLSFKAGVARSSIREIIAGRSNPRLLTLVAISKALGYPTLAAFFVEIEND